MAQTNENNENIKSLHVSHCPCKKKTLKKSKKLTPYKSKRCEISSAHAKFFRLSLTNVTYMLILIALSDAILYPLRSAALKGQFACGTTRKNTRFPVNTI